MMGWLESALCLFELCVSSRALSLVESALSLVCFCLFVGEGVLSALSFVFFLLNDCFVWSAEGISSVLSLVEL